VRHLNKLGAQEPGATRYEIVGLATGRNLDAMTAQARAMGVHELALCGDGSTSAEAPEGCTLRTGPDSARQLVEQVEADVVIGAMVGFSGLPATLAAVERGRDVALANKETLVAAGALVVEAARKTGARLLPVDSEHSGVWQALASGERHAAPPCSLGKDVRRVILTASGGALRTRTVKEMYTASVEDALAHPNWSMGAKVTIDSASLTNKALEVIEAHWLFDLPPEQIGVLIHPQSVVHALVEYADGSVIAQLGAPDMKTPIQYALTFPGRPPGCSKLVDFLTMSRLDFDPPDPDRFPALWLGYRVIAEGGTSGAVFNGANERAVEAFLKRKIAFGRIAELSRAAMDALGFSPLRNLGDAVAADAEARKFVASALGERS